MSLRFKLILILTALNLCGGIQEVKKSLVIVLDVTASMSKVINLIRQESMTLLDNINYWHGNVFQNYILVQFGDEVNKRESSKVFEGTNYSNMKSELNAVKIERSVADLSCTASCYGGLLIALELAKNDSVVLVFTDAGTKNKNLLDDIKKLTQQKRITFYFTLTKGCAETKPAEDYRHLISIYNGDIYSVDNSQIEKHFELLGQILTGPPNRPSIEIIVDSTMSEFILTIAGLNAIITIFDPEEKYVSSTRHKMLTNLSSIKMIQVSDPMPGRYTIEIVSETSYTGQVQTKTDLQFKYGFAIHEPLSMSEISYAPFKDYETYLAISPSNATLIMKLDHVVLATSSSEKYKFHLNRKSTPNDELYVTDAFSIPSKPFRIYVHGLDRKNYLISRLISPVIAAIAIDLPEVVVDNPLTAVVGEPIHLVCRVQSDVNVTINWLKVGLTNKLAFLKSNQSGTLNYTIENSKESDSGEYICTAENIAGKIESKSFVTIKQIERFQVFTPIKYVNSVVGTKMLELQCNVSHLNYHTVRVSWLFNGKPVLPLGSRSVLSNLVLFNIERNYGGIYTCIGHKEEMEIRDEIQLNVMFPPEIMNVFNFYTDEVINITKPLEIVNKTELLIICVYYGKPIPTVQWVDTSGDIVSNTSKFRINEATRAGEYSCQVTNHLGQDKRTIKVSKSPKTDRPEISRYTPKHIIRPIVLQNYNKVEQLIEGNSFTMRCPIEIGEYNVSWILNGKSIDHLKRPNETIYIDSVYANMTGTTLCVASNQAGSTTVSINFEVLRPPYGIEVETSPDRNFSVNKRYEIRCRANGNPDPLLYWLKNGNFYMIGNTIIFDKIQSRDNGNYTCDAENRVGKRNTTFILQVSVPVQISAYDILIDTSTNIPPIVNERFEMVCTAKGDPAPKLYWMKNGISFKNDSSIVFQKIQTNDIGNYTCIAENQSKRIHKSFILNVSSSKKLTKPANITLSNTSTNKNMSLSRPLSYSSTKENSTTAQSTSVQIYRKTELEDQRVDDKLGQKRPENKADRLKTQRITAKYISKPIVLQNYNKIEQLIEGTSFTMRCPIEIGEYNVSWILNGKSIDHLKRPNEAIYIDLVYANMTGAALCVASNQAGSATASINFEVLRPPYGIEVETLPDRNFFVNNRYEIRCRANGSPDPDLYWLKNGNFSSRGDTIIFDKIQSRDNGNYTCAAENRVGKRNTTFILQVSVPAQTNVYGIQVDTSTNIPTTDKPTSKPILLQNYNQVQELIEGNSFTMRCPIEIGEYNVSWILNGKSIDHLKQSNEAIYIDSVYTNMTGDALCVASNQAGSATASINFEVLRPPYGIEVETSPDRKFFVNSRYEIRCRANGKPDPNVYWLKNGKFFREENVIIFDMIHSRDNGNYTCAAENPFGQMNQTLILQVSEQIPPYDLQINKSKDKPPAVNERYAMSCNAKGDPVPEMYWMKNDVLFQNGSQIVFQKIHTNDNGRYTCIAKNALGSINKIYNLHILDPNTFTNLANIGRSAYDIKIYTARNKLPFINERYEIFCSAKGDPDPELYWMKNEVFLDNGKSIMFQNVQPNDNGKYTCVAGNYLGNVNKTFILQVIDPGNNNRPNSSTSLVKTKQPYDIQVDISIDKQPLINEQYEIKCSAKGYPKPNLYWTKNQFFYINKNNITFSKLQSSDQGNYTCTAQNSEGSISKIHILQVYSPPIFENSAYFVRATNANNAIKLGRSTILRFVPVVPDYFIANFEKTILVNENERVFLNCTMYGNPAPKIEWFKNSVKLNSSGQSFLDYGKASIKNNGIYKCIGSNTFGELKAIFYVDVKMPLANVTITSYPKKLYMPVNNLIIACKSVGNPLPIFSIFTKDFITGTNRVFDVNTTSILFQNGKKMYFDGFKIIDAETAKSLKRYSMLSYDNSFSGTFRYVIKSVRPKDADTYTCSAVTSSIKIRKYITIRISSRQNQKSQNKFFNN